MDKKISIIVPFYDVEKYAIRCIESIINQKYKNLEIILIDDGSPDNCGKICDQYAKKDNRIKVVHKENQGVSIARNVGMEKAQGDYIWFVDSDDYISDDSIDILSNVINKKDYDVIVFNYNTVDNDGKLESIIEKYPNKNFAIECFEERGIGGYIGNRIYKKSSLKKLYFENKIKMCEDLLFNLRFNEINNDNLNYFFINKNLYNYYTNPKSAVNSRYKTDYTRLYVVDYISTYMKRFDNIYYINSCIEYILDYRRICYYNRIKNQRVPHLYKKILKNKIHVLKYKFPLNKKIKIIIAYYFPHIFYLLIKIGKA